MTDSAGARLKRAILEIYDLDAGELVLLDHVVQVCDSLDRINRVAAGRGWVKEADIPFVQTHQSSRYCW